MLRKNLLYKRKVIAICAAHMMLWLGFWAVGDCVPCSISEDKDEDMVVCPILPLKAVETVFDILSTVNRLFPDAKLLLFHLDAAGAFGVIKLDERGNHLIVTDLIEFDDAVVLLDGKPITETRRLKVRTYGMTTVMTGNDSIRVENRASVSAETLGTLFDLKDNLPFSLSCSAFKDRSKGGLDIRITCDRDGEWRAKFAPTKGDASEGTDVHTLHNKATDETSPADNRRSAPRRPGSPPPAK